MAAVVRKLRRELTRPPLLLSFVVGCIEGDGGGGGKLVCRTFLVCEQDLYLNKDNCLLFNY
jgi:hypothetical protein